MLLIRVAATDQTFWFGRIKIRKRFASSFLLFLKVRIRFHILIQNLFEIGLKNLIIQIKIKDKYHSYIEILLQQNDNNKSDQIFGVRIRIRDTGFESQCLMKNPIYVNFIYISFIELLCDILIIFASIFLYLQQ